MPMRPMPVSVLAGVVKGRALVRLLDQMELLNGVLDHTLLQLPRIDVAVWVGEPELAGQEGLGSVTGESHKYEGPLLNSFQLLWEA